MLAKLVVPRLCISRRKRALNEASASDRSARGKMQCWKIWACSVLLSVASARRGKKSTGSAKQRLGADTDQRKTHS
jgi:hypothetical protein